MIPRFDERGNLPPGIHHARWEEVFERFGGHEWRRILILNERQYRITKAAETRIAEQIEDLEREGAKDLRPRQREVLVKAAKEQLQELRREIEEFDALRKGATPIAPIGSIEELPLALIRARIARGWTQADLAEQLGVAEQQVQRDEANAYRGASFERIRRIAEVLGVRLHGFIKIVS